MLASRWTYVSKLARESLLVTLVFVQPLLEGGVDAVFLVDDIPGDIVDDVLAKMEKLLTSHAFVLSAQDEIVSVLGPRLDR